MKKFLPYILIIVLVGLLSPLGIIYADSTDGDCFAVNISVKNYPITPIDSLTSHDACMGAHGVMTPTSDPSLRICKLGGVEIGAGNQYDCEHTFGLWCTLTQTYHPDPDVGGKCVDNPSTPPGGGGGPSFSTTTYTLLAPLPGLDQTFDVTQTSGLGNYLNIMIDLLIGICAVLAVVMIVIGGIEYMTSELVSSKEHGKERIRNALLGLLLALGAVLILQTINPDLLNLDFSSITTQTVNVTLQNQLKSYSGQGPCTPVSSGSCSPANLAAAGFLPEPPRATQASSICNGESNGNASLASGVDKCKDGNSFSLGLFQINVIAHANEIPGGVCSNVFTVNGGGAQGACLKSQNGICIERDCSVADNQKYQSCINYITNPVNNINFAIGLQARGGWSQWGANNSCHY